MKDIRRAIRFLLLRGYVFDSDFPSWSHPMPEHYQPTEGELEAANFLDKAPVNLSFLEIVINNVKRELKL